VPIGVPIGPGPSRARRGCRSATFAWAIFAQRMTKIWRHRQPPAPGVPDVELLLTAAPDEVAVLPGAPTSVWRFSGRLLKGPADTLHTLPGSYLGPVIRLRRGQKVRVRFANQLGEDSIVHGHGWTCPRALTATPAWPSVTVANTCTSSK
jgi:FtsP/CotA-like multicopper oxidase with cupredoxin domain